jgi:hypothetical protein
MRQIYCKKLLIDNAEYIVYVGHTDSLKYDLTVWAPCTNESYAHKDGTFPHRWRAQTLGELIRLSAGTFNAELASVIRDAIYQAEDLEAGEERLQAYTGQGVDKNEKPYLWFDYPTGQWCVLNAKGELVRLGMTG